MGRSGQPQPRTDKAMEGVSWIDCNGLSYVINLHISEPPKMALQALVTPFSVLSVGGLTMPPPTTTDHCRETLLRSVQNPYSCAQSVRRERVALS